MLDIMLHEYSFDVSVRGDKSFINLDYFSAHAMMLDPERGEKISWSTKNGDLLVHYLAKADHLKNFPNSLLKDLQSGKAVLIVRYNKKQEPYFIERMK